MSDTEQNESEQIGNGIDPIQLEPGTGIALLVGGTRYETRTLHNRKGVGADPEDAREIRLEPYPSGGIKSRDDPEAEIQFIPAGHRNSVAEAPATLGLPDMIDHESLQRTMLESAATLAENGEHEQADRLAAAAVGYYSEAEYRD